MKKVLKKKSIKVILFLLIVLLIMCTIFCITYGTKFKAGKIDDWKYSKNKETLESSVIGAFYTGSGILGGVINNNFEMNSESSISGGGKTSAQSAICSVDSADSSGSYSSKGASSYTSSKKTDSYIGYTVGGASNVDSFRQNIENNYFPISTDITYNGLYSEYYFDTGNDKIIQDKMFYPSYSCAVSTDPISNEKEYYMSIGLNSNIKESDFKRKKINLVVLLDISGSMSSSFNSYYYDENKKASDSKSKMKIAEECINNLIEKLNPDDRLGVVLFDDQAYLGKEIRMVSETDIEAIQDHILEIEPQGGTNFSAGYEKATKLFSEYLNDSEYQNRIVIVTDAMPNLGDTSSSGLYSKIKENSDDKIYTSLIGVGVDFNTELTEKISDVSGANYYSVHDYDEFNKILVEDFDYMITSLVYDLNLNFESNNYEIENIYGTDSADISTGNIVHVNTLFPSSSNSEGEVKGGIIVLKLKKKDNSMDNKIELKISYKDTSDIEYNDSEIVVFKEADQDYYDNTGIRKAIVLSRYVNALKNWIIYERTSNDDFIINEQTGIKEFNYDNTYIQKALGKNERKSTKLIVSDIYKEVFKQMKNYIKEQNKELKDDTLKNEIKILNKLI